MFVLIIFHLAARIFWILDITNMPFMEQFDTTYPLNTAFWLLMWIFVFGIGTRSDDKKKHDVENIENREGGDSVG